MEKKSRPVILVVSSSEEKGAFSKQLSEYFAQTGSHYVVIIDESKYGNGDSYIRKVPLLKTRYLSLLKKRVDGLKVNKEKKLKGRIKKIRNAIKRFNPVAVVCTTAYALLGAIETKKRAMLQDIPIIAVATSFTLDKNYVDTYVDHYIVENDDIKDQLASAGILQNNILPLGFPLKLKPTSKEEKAELKQKLGLNDVPTVFMSISDSPMCVEVFDMLLDQGDIININAFCDKSEILHKLRKLIEEKSSDNVQLFDKLNLFDDYLKASDFVVTNYDVVTMYKAFMMEKPVMAFAPLTEVEKNDLEYLSERNQILFCKETKDVILRLYDLLQTDIKKELVYNAKQRIKDNQLEEIGKFLSSFTGNTEAEQ